MKLTVNTIPPAPPKLIRTVVIELTEREAEVLMRVCDYVAGSDAGPRGLFDAISSALHHNGILYPPCVVAESTRSLRLADKWHREEDAR